MALLRRSLYEEALPPDSQRKLSDEPLRAGAALVLSAVVASAAISAGIGGGAHASAGAHLPPPAGAGH